MPRLVKFDATGPVKIDPATVPPGKMIWVCACGLSKAFPICDKSHKACEGEDPARVYVYDPGMGARRECGPETPGAR